MYAARAKEAEIALKASGDVDKSTSILKGEYDLKNPNLRSERIKALPSTTLFAKKDSSVNRDEQSFKRLIARVIDVRNEFRSNNPKKEISRKNLKNPT